MSIRLDHTDVRFVGPQHVIHVLHYGLIRWRNKQKKKILFYFIRSVPGKSKTQLDENQGFATCSYLFIVTFVVI